MDKVKNNLKSLYEQRQKYIEESNYIKAGIQKQCSRTA